MCTAEGPVVEQPTVLTSKRDTLRSTLVDNAHRNLSQTVYVGLSGTVVATLDGVVEEAMHRITVVLVILGRIDATLSRHRMGPTRGTVEHEVVHLVPQLGQGR